MQALTVSALVSFLREVIEGNEFFSDLWVAGEVSNYTRSTAGHRYFSLKDGGAMLRSVWFASTMPSGKLENGDRVLAHGRVSVYVQRGELQFVCDFVRPEGVGLQAAKLEELRLRLDGEGLFDPLRKRPLPPFPRRIGLVTSPNGAALQDIRNVLAKRWPLAELVLSPAIVQGEAAPGHVEVALKRLARETDLDVAIIARGGGSAEDLSAFNDERVVRAVFGFPAPIVSGVGHETDVTLTDLVADLRAPTPSAAAERCTPDIAELRRALRVRNRTMASAALGAIARSISRIDGIASQLNRAVVQPALLGHEVLVMASGLRSKAERSLAADRAHFERLAASFLPLNPHRTLQRGFAIIEKPAGNRKSVIASVRKVRSGDRLIVSVADGAFSTEVS
jgi:exodeoxyribonuclease VII large subunit